MVEEDMRNYMKYLLKRHNYLDSLQLTSDRSARYDSGYDSIRNKRMRAIEYDLHHAHRLFSAAGVDLGDMLLPGLNTDTSDPDIEDFEEDTEEVEGEEAEMEEEEDVDIDDAELGLCTTHSSVHGDADSGFGGSSS